MQSLYISMVYVALLALGCTAPFVFSLGYVWIDAFEPQVISPLLAAIPVALIMGVAAFGSYLTMDRKFPPKQWAMIALMLVMAAWVTITTTWAVAGDWAWVKWDWALKTIVFAAFIPFVFRSRVQIEAFIQVYVISLGVNIIPFAIKTLISGSAYGRNLGASVGVGELSESSTLAAVAVMCVPLSLCWVEHSLLVPFPRLRRWAYYGYACVCLLCAVGTYARTGLVAMALLGVAMWFQTKRKVLLGAFMALAVVVGGAYTAASWQERMMTI
ncbi:MAG: hypothetical protein JOY70_08065, partial [Acidisphaera sp.]|nr:hypothetical protein [Acidisphaera sp.]